MISKSVNDRRVAKGGEGEDSPPAQPKYVHFAQNRKHAFFDAML